jgi:hypothetical protein
MSADPFEGDYGGSGDSDAVLSDRIVTARKESVCHTCAQKAIPGTRVRRRSEVYDGEFMRFSWCEKCCKAMASEDFEEFEQRVVIGDKARTAASADRREE